MKPDLKGIRRLSPAELALRRHQREEKRPATFQKKFKPKKAYIRVVKVKRGRRTIVSSVSIKPDLKYRAARDLGDGSFSRAIDRVLTKALQEFDRERGE